MISTPPPSGTLPPTGRKVVVQGTEFFTFNSSGKLIHLETLSDDLGLLSQLTVRSTVWTYFSEYPADAVFMGGELARLPVVTLQIYVLAGGLDGPGKRKLIEDPRSTPRRDAGYASVRRFMRSRKKTGASSANKPIWPLYGRSSHSKYAVSHLG